MSRPARKRGRPRTHDEHPRQRLLANGAQALSDAELVEILLRNGGSASAARELARELLAEFGGLVGLANINPVYLRRHQISDAKAATVVAALEIACRVAKARVPRQNLLDQPALVANYLSLRYGQRDQETMGALFLNVRNRLIGETEIFRGTQERTAVSPRAIMKEALLRSASRFVLFHTHPSPLCQGSCRLIWNHYRFWGQEQRSDENLPDSTSGSPTRRPVFGTDATASSVGSCP